MPFAFTSIIPHSKPVETVLISKRASVRWSRISRLRANRLHYRHGSAGMWGRGPTEGGADRSHLAACYSSGHLRIRSHNAIQFRWHYYGVRSAKCGRKHLFRKKCVARKCEAWYETVSRDRDSNGQARLAARHGIVKGVRSVHEGGRKWEKGPGIQRSRPVVTTPCFPEVIYRCRVFLWRYSAFSYLSSPAMTNPVSPADVLANVPPIGPRTWRYLLPLSLASNTALTTPAEQALCISKVVTHVHRALFVTFLPGHVISLLLRSPYHG